MAKFWRAIVDHLSVEFAVLVGGLLLGFLGKIFGKKKENVMAEIVQENKAFELKLEGEFLMLKVDPNKDGEVLLEMKVSLKEVPDEVLGLFKKA